MTIEELEIERKKINNEWTELRNKQYNIEQEYQKLIQEKCKENIGRCFKKLRGEKVASYCIIINIDKPKSQLNGSPLFNEYQYPAIKTLRCHFMKTIYFLVHGVKVLIL